MKYEIEFEKDGVMEVEDYKDCKDVGMAFARCQKEHKPCKLIRARAWGRFRDGEGWIDYTPPPVQRDPIKEPRPARALKSTEKGCEFPFYDEVVGHKP